MVGYEVIYHCRSFNIIYIMRTNEKLAVLPERALSDGEITTLNRLSVLNNSYNALRLPEENFTKLSMLALLLDDPIWIEKR